MKHLQTHALIIMTPHCENQQGALAKFSHIWMIDSDSNQALANQLRSHRTKDTNASVTIFDKSNDICSILYDVESHHGAATAGTPITSIEAHGTTLTEEVIDTLHKLGFKAESMSDSAFRATWCNDLPST